MTGVQTCALPIWSTAYALHYGDRALPNTTLAGHNVSGMSHDEVVALVADLKQTLTITAAVGNDTTMLPLTDLRFYHDEHILTDNEGERDAKLLLVKASVILLKNVLKILGMESPDKM